VNVTCGSAELDRVKPSSLRLLSGLSINACIEEERGVFINRRRGLEPNRDSGGIFY